MAVVKVPKTPKASFDKDRRPSALLLDQIKHLEWAVLPASQRKPQQLAKGTVKTEGQAAERIAQLTRMVLDARTTAAAEPMRAVTAPPAPVVLPPLPRSPRRARTPGKRATVRTQPAAARPPKTARKPAPARARGARSAASRRRKAR